jgi:hypothetical protein
MLGMLTEFSMTNATLGAVMIGLSLLALICQFQRKQKPAPSIYR